MTKPDPRGDNPNATIQLSALDAAELVQFDAPDPADAAAEPPRSRAAPPPLPPTPPGGPASPIVAAPATPATATGGSKALVYGGIFVVLLAGAVAAGLAVGSYARARRARTEPAPVAPTLAAAPVATVAPPVASSSAPRPLVIPTVEVSSPAP